MSREKKTSGPQDRIPPGLRLRHHWGEKVPGDLSYVFGPRSLAQFRRLI